MHCGTRSVGSLPVDLFSPGLQSRAPFVTRAVAVEAQKFHLSEVLGL
jgi:hypothetical protein